MGTIDLTQGRKPGCQTHIIVHSLKEEGELGIQIKTVHREYYLEASSAEQRVVWVTALMQCVSVTLFSFLLFNGVGEFASYVRL